MSNQNKGNVALLLAAVIWGSGFIAQKMGMDTIGPYFFNDAYCWACAYATSSKDV